jgi:hypothetical protein
MYVPEYSGKYGSTRIGEYSIQLPDLPKEKDIINYNKSIKDQKVIPNAIPKEILTWSPDLMEDYIIKEFHKRIHGVWYFIKGEPYYLPGTAYTYYNYWREEKGYIPNFRIEGLEFFLLWDYIEKDPNCLGMLDIKARRLGDTDKSLFLLWHYGSLHRMSKIGMQHTTDEDSKKNFMRMCTSASKMPFFFKPISKNVDIPSSELIYDLPEEKTSKDILNTQKENYGFNGLLSRFTYESTKNGKYDGQRLDRYFMDECFKINPARMDVMEQWGIVKRTMTLFNDSMIVGKAILASTVEDVANGRTLEVAEKMWDYSNPKEKDSYGRTVSGLYRIFRGFELASEVDEYGFHKKAEARLRRDEAIRALEKRGDLVEMARLKRKQPADIHEALGLGGADCPFSTVLLERRTRQIKNGQNALDEYKEDPLLPVRGDLHWKNGQFGGLVEWSPNPDGRFSISKHPDTANNKEILYGNIVLPGNRFLYRMGVDPIDTLTTSADRSNGGIAIYEPFNPAKELHLVYDDNGVVLNPDKMVTDRFICTYTYRPDDPFEFFQDCLKCAIYYGVSAYIETDKPYVKNEFVNRGFINYLQIKPKELGGRRALNQNYGQKSNTEAIYLYIDLLAAHFNRQWTTYNHIDLLEDMRKFTHATRGKRDLTVAAGFALLANTSRKLAQSTEEQKNGYQELWNKTKERIM